MNLAIRIIYLLYNLHIIPIRLTRFNKVSFKYLVGISDVIPSYFGLNTQITIEDYSILDYIKY